MVEGIQYVVQILTESLRDARAPGGEEGREHGEEGGGGRPVSQLDGRPQETQLLVVVEVE